MKLILAIVAGLIIYSIANSFDPNHGFSRRWWIGYFVGCSILGPVVLIILFLTPQ